VSRVGARVACRMCCVASCTVQHTFRRTRRSWWNAGRRIRIPSCYSPSLARVCSRVDVGRTALSTESVYVVYTETCDSFLYMYDAMREGRSARHVPRRRARSRLPVQQRHQYKTRCAARCHPIHVILWRGRVLRAPPQYSPRSPGLRWSSPK
jgi:hypothetical protein